MWSNVVVPVLEYVQVGVELFDTCDDPLVEFVFQRTEQPFDSAVLPRAAGVGALVADAELLQPKTEYA